MKTAKFLHKRTGEVVNVYYYSGGRYWYERTCPRYLKSAGQAETPVEVTIRLSKSDGLEQVGDWQEI